jgi:hypothetical protein
MNAKEGHVEIVMIRSGYEIGINWKHVKTEMKLKLENISK